MIPTIGGVIGLGVCAGLGVLLPRVLGPSAEETRTSITHRCTDEGRQGSLSSSKLAMGGAIRSEEIPPVSVHKGKVWEVSYGLRTEVDGGFGTIDIPIVITCVYTEDEARSNAKAGRMRYQVGDQDPLEYVLKPDGTCGESALSQSN